MISWTTSESEGSLYILPPVHAPGKGWKVGDERTAGVTKETSEEFIKMIGLKNTREILEFLNENERGQYNFSKFANNHILNVRLRQLLVFGLIEHHLTRGVKRIE